MPPGLHQEGGYILRDARHQEGIYYYLFHIESLRNFATPSLGAKVHISAMEFEQKLAFTIFFIPSHQSYLIL